VEIRRGDHVQATDGHIGRVQGLVIDRRSGHVTLVLLQRERWRPSAGEVIWYSALLYLGHV
jgi:hypothetical protein